MGFVRRAITSALDLANLKRHNDNFADIETDLNAHDGRIANAQTEITTHRASEKAHAAETITYKGAVVGADNTQDALDALKETVDSVIVGGGDGTQAAAAAVSVSGTAHPTLKQRVDTEYLETNAKFSEVDAQLADNASFLQEVEYNIRWNALMALNGIWTTAINTAIDYVASIGGGFVKIPSGTFDIDGPIYNKSRVTIIGNNPDTSVYKYNQAFKDVFSTTIRLIDGANCDMVIFDDGVYSACIKGVFLNGNRSKNTTGRGVYLNSLVDNFRARNKLESVMIAYCADEGIYNANFQYESKFINVAVFYCGSSTKSGMYLGGQDCITEEVLIGYNYGDGFEASYGGALRSYNIDSFGNSGYGFALHDVQSLSFIKATVNGNGKGGVKIYSTSGGYAPSKIEFIGSSIFGNGNGYSEILLENAYGPASPHTITFVASEIGSRTRAVNGLYLVENTAANKYDLSFTGCNFNTTNYTDAFNVSNIYTLTGCSKNRTDQFDSYSRTLKQKGGIDLAIAGYDFKSSDATLAASKTFNTISAASGNKTITLPKANAFKGGQEITVRKHDASVNTITIVASSGDSIDAPLAVLSSSKQVLKFASDGVSIWLNSN